MVFKTAATNPKPAPLSPAAQEQPLEHHRQKSAGFAHLNEALGEELSDTVHLVCTLRYDPLPKQAPVRVQSLHHCRCIRPASKASV